MRMLFFGLLIVKGISSNLIVRGSPAPFFFYTNVTKFREQNLLMTGPDEEKTLV
jgi:hypothetical protein